MLDALRAMLCLLQNLALMFVWALVEVVNLVWSGLEGAAQLAAALLPPFPDPPSNPLDFTAAKWLAWVIPVQGLAILVGSLAAIYLVWLGLSAFLRWVKVI